MRNQTGLSMRAALALGLALGTLGSAGCSSSDDGDSDGSVNGSGSGTERQIQVPATVVFGLVERAGGGGLAGAAVTGGTEPATTGPDGRFEVRAAVGQRIVFRFEAEGYLPASRTVDVLEKKATSVHAKLLAIAPAQPLDATMGGSVAGARGATMTAPAGAFVDAAGAAVAGMVDVHLTPIDPSDANEVVANSGDFLGVNPAGGAPQALESFGMLDVTVTQGGEKLQVADGMGLAVTIPAPARMPAGAAPPDSIPLWSFDHAQDRWVLEGDATFDAATGTYRASLGHMSAWNCDRPLEATCITGLVKDSSGTPLAGSAITAEGVNYFGTSSGTTGEDGRFYVAVKKDSDVSVLAEHSQGGGQIRQVRSGNADTDVPPTAGDPRCLDVGEWQVVAGQVSLTDGRTIDCADTDNPFTEGCAADLWQGAFECVKPWNTCDYRTTPGSTSTEVVYDNGNRMVSEYDMATGTSHSTFYDGDRVCYTQDTSGIGVGAGQTVTVTFTLPNGQAWQWAIDTSDGGGGDITITCPGGEVVIFTAEEREILKACMSNGDSDEDGESSMMCTYNGMASPTPVAPGGGGSMGNIGTMCEGDGDCTGDNSCCPIMSQGMTYSFCYPEMYCAQIQQAAAMGGQ